jgi:RHH-type transcriptional regulator, rel operon repressor / antitoxin RelB
MTISVRLPEKMAKYLSEVATETERSKSFHIQKAVELYLEDFANLQIARDRLMDKSDKLISADEMRQKIGI